MAVAALHCRETKANKKKIDIVSKSWCYVMTYQSWAPRRHPKPCCRRRAMSATKTLAYACARGVLCLAFAASKPPSSDGQEWVLMETPARLPGALNLARSPLDVAARGTTRCAVHSPRPPCWAPFSLSAAESHINTRQGPGTQTYLLCLNQQEPFQGWKKCLFMLLWSEPRWGTSGMFEEKAPDSRLDAILKDAGEQESNECFVENMKGSFSFLVVSLKNVSLPG